MVEAPNAKENEERRLTHWSERLAEDVVAKKSGPYFVTGGMTTSGTPHLGTVCEFLYPYVISQTLREKGEIVEFVFIGDILDAFDGVPSDLAQFEKELTPELGKPLVHTIDPFKCHSSYGEHFLSAAEGLMQKLELKIKAERVNVLYEKGMFDPYASLYLMQEEKVKEVVARTSFRKIEDMKNWSPIMPICAQCGKIATTRVTWHDDKEYEYSCDVDVKYTKGCGYKGRNKISDHRYKLSWRLHWPSWQAIFNTSIEFSGVEHMTRGSSADTAIAIHKEILEREPPILGKYGLIMLHGKKYSKSKGIGMGAGEIMEFIPPELLKYMLIEPDLPSNKDIDPTGDKLVLLYNEVEKISTMKAPQNRAEEKKMVALRLATPKLHWKASFTEILINYQIYKDWGEVGARLDDREGVKYLAPYIDNWLARGLAPEKYKFSLRPAKITEHKDAIIDFVNRLKENMTDLEVHNLVYDVATEHKIRADELFKQLYLGTIGKESGPKIGKLLSSLGVAKTKELINIATS
ncbi:MAG: lysine--tRNA ligase [Candidatus Micrarchaeota archaeon]|nr:lysine--tRNA ligase [Candidatus Micrarchaeota archaeon]